MGDPGPTTLATYAARQHLSPSSPQSPSSISGHSSPRPAQPSFSAYSTRSRSRRPYSAYDSVSEHGVDGYVEVPLDTPDLSADYQPAGWKGLPRGSKGPKSNPPRNFIGGFVRGLRKTFKTSKVPTPTHNGSVIPPALRPGPSAHTEYTGHTKSAYSNTTFPDAGRDGGTRYVEQLGSPERGSPTEITFDVTSPVSPSSQPSSRRKHSSHKHMNSHTSPVISPDPPVQFPVPVPAPVDLAPDSRHPEIQPPRRMRPHSGSKSQSHSRGASHVGSHVPAGGTPQTVLPTPSNPPPPPPPPILVPPPGPATLQPPIASSAIPARHQLSPDYRKMGSSVPLPPTGVTLSQTSSNPAGEPSFSSELHPFQKLLKEWQDMPWVSPGRVTVSYRPGLARGGMTIKVSRNGKRRLFSKASKTWYPTRGTSSLLNLSSVGSEKGVKYVFSPASSEKTATVDLLSSGSRSQSSRKSRRTGTRTTRATHGPTSPRSEWSTTVSSGSSPRVFSVNSDRRRRSNYTASKRRYATPFAMPAPLSPESPPRVAVPTPPKRRNKKSASKVRTPKGNAHPADPVPQPSQPQVLHMPIPYDVPMYPYGYAPYQLHTPPLSFIAPVPPPLQPTQAHNSTPSPVYFLDRPPPTPKSSSGLGNSPQSTRHDASANLNFVPGPGHLVSPVYLQMAPGPPTAMMNSSPNPSGTAAHAHVPSPLGNEAH